MTWDVQEVPPSGGGGWDSQCMVAISSQGFFNGKLVERGRVILPDGRKVETDR